MILAKIIKEKIKEITRRKKTLPLNNLIKKINKTNYTTRNFQKAISRKGINLIAEIKKASPSKGILCEKFNPLKLAKIYERSGAQALSVLTDEKFFQGKLEFIPRIKKVSRLPILRKDFIIDAYQVYESKFFGADAILLIAGILRKDLLMNLLNLAKKLGLDVVVEVHTKNDLIKTLKVNARIIGINNRSLRTFKTNLKTTQKLLKFIPKNKIIISESGINSNEDILYLKNLKRIDAILIGEALVTSFDIKRKIKQLQDV